MANARTWAGRSAPIDDVEERTMRGRMLRLTMAVLTAALATALAIMLVGCGGDEGEEGATGEPIKIGVIVSLSGPYAGLGQPEKNALEMELQDLNDAGGVNGRPVELIFEDDATDEAKAVAAASKLIEQDQVVAIIGPTGTGQTMAVRGDVERGAIPQVSMAGGTVITNPVHELVFATPWPNTIVVPFTLEHLTARGITKIGLISDSGGFGKDGQAVLAAAAPDAGIDIVADVTFNPGDTDMTAQLTKIKNSGAEAVVMWTAGAEAAIIAKNAMDLGIELPIYGSHGIARKEFIEGAGEAAEGVQFAAGKVLVPEAYGEGTEAYEVATDFISQYEETWGEAPSTFAGHAYDAFWIIAEAAKRVDDDLTPAALRDAIEATDGFVGIGGTFSYSPTDHNGMTAEDLTMYEIAGGTWTLVE
jgi:branched-chain amino acid transport system substrate-binding protein